MGVEGTVVIPNPVMRHEIADYLKVGETFELMGLGFESLNESPNAQSSSKTYINQNHSLLLLNHISESFRIQQI